MKAFISRRDFLKAAGITAAAAALAGCSSSGGSASGSSAGGKTIRVGVFEPASGDNGAGGKQEVLGVEYANSLAPTVEIGGETYNVELVEVDNQSSTDKAVTAAQELVSKKVSIVLGSYGSGVSIAAAPTFQSASIPAIGCSCTNPAVTEANPYYFRVCFLDPFQGSVMANFAKDEFSASNAYVLSMLGEDYGSGLATYFVNAFEDLGGTVTSEQFPEGTSDFSAYIQNAINAGADVIFAPCATTYAAQIITQAASAGFDKPITAGDTWESSVILDAQKGTSVQATTFKSSMTYEILLIVVIGGIGSVSGSIIASFLFIASSEWLLRFLDNETWIGGFRVPLLRSGFRMVVFSIIIMAVVLFFRKGIMGDRELFQKKPTSTAKAAKKEARSK